MECPSCEKTIPAMAGLRPEVKAAAPPICGGCWLKTPAETLEAWKAKRITNHRLIAIARERIASCKSIGGGKSGARVRGGR